MMPTESLLINGEWLPGELLSGLERETPGWFLDMNIRLARYEISDLFSKAVMQNLVRKPGYAASCGASKAIGRLVYPSVHHIPTTYTNATDVTCTMNSTKVQNPRRYGGAHSA